MHLTFSKLLFFSNRRMNFSAIIVTVIILTLWITWFILLFSIPFSISFLRSELGLFCSPIRVHSGIVSLSLRFRFRFKLGFHRIKNYQTTWLSLSFLLCRNPMMLTTTTMRATTMVTPKTLKYREENDEQKKSRQTALKLKSDRAKSLTHIKFPCAFFLLAFFLRSWDDVIGTHKQHFKLDFHNSSESSVEQCIFINLKTNHYFRNSDLNWTQQHQLLW